MSCKIPFTGYTTSQYTCGTAFQSLLSAFLIMSVNNKKIAGSVKVTPIFTKYITLLISHSRSIQMQKKKCRWCCLTHRQTYVLCYM